MKRSLNLLLAVLLGTLVLAACNPSDGGTDDPYAGRELTLSDTLPTFGGEITYSDGYTLHAPAFGNESAEPFATTTVADDGSFTLQLPKRPADDKLATLEEVLICADPGIADTPIGLVTVLDLYASDGQRSFSFPIPAESGSAALAYFTEPLGDLTTCETPSSGDGTLTYEFDDSVGWVILAQHHNDTTTTFSLLEPSDIAFPSDDTSGTDGDAPEDGDSGTGDDAEDGEDEVPMGPNLSGTITSLDLTTTDVAQAIPQGSDAVLAASPLSSVGDAFTFSLDLPLHLDPLDVSEASDYDFPCTTAFDTLDTAIITPLTLKSDDGMLLGRLHHRPEGELTPEAKLLYVLPDSMPEGQTVVQDDGSCMAGMPITYDVSLKEGWNTLYITRTGDGGFHNSTTAPASGTDISWTLEPEGR